MGIFDDMDDSVDVNMGTGRKDDEPGVYIQRIDDISLEKTKKTKKKKEYVKMHKTTVYVVNDKGGQAHDVGTETTQAFFEDDWGYYVRDMKQLIKAAFDLDDDEANELSAADMARILVEDKELNGLALKVDVTRVRKRDAEGDDEDSTFIRHKFLEQVSDEELQELLGDDYETWFEAE